MKHERGNNLHENIIDDDKVNDYEVQMGSELEKYEPQQQK